MSQLSLSIFPHPASNVEGRTKRTYGGFKAILKDNLFRITADARLLQIITLPLSRKWKTDKNGTTKGPPVFSHFSPSYYIEEFLGGVCCGINLEESELHLYWENTISELGKLSPTIPGLAIKHLARCRLLLLLLLILSPISNRESASKLLSFERARSQHSYAELFTMTLIRGEDTSVAMETCFILSEI